MEETGSCTICFFNKPNKTLPCEHSLCQDCAIRLNKSNCPYCRKVFNFTIDELKERIKLGIADGYKWEAPPGLEFRPQDWIENNRNNNTIFIYDSNDAEYYIYNQPFARIARNTQRKRRRNLSFDEVLERRHFIKKRIERHKERQEGRLRKVKWYEDDE
jgi:hypothetical protein